MKHIQKFLLVVLLTTIHQFSFSQIVKKSQQTVFITDVNSVNRVTVISVDYLEMLTGKAAVRAARKNGEAEFDINAKGDSTWYVPNDYYVVNNNKTIRKFELSRNADILIIKENGSTLTKSTIKLLKNNYKDQLFTINLNDKKIVQIKQIYTP